MTKPTTTTRDAVFVIGDGTVTALAGGPVSLADMGPRTTKRLSKVEFNSATSMWEVTDATTGELLAWREDYDAAIKWETEYYNQLLAEVPEAPAFKTTG